MGRKKETFAVAWYFFHILNAFCWKLPLAGSNNLRRINCRQQETISDIPLIITNRQRRVNKVLPLAPPTASCQSSIGLSIRWHDPPTATPLANHKPSIVGQIALMRHGVLGFLGLCPPVDSQQSERHLHYWQKPRVIAWYWLLNSWV